MGVKVEDLKTRKKIWDPEEAEFSTPWMVRRIETTLKSKIWAHAIAVMTRDERPLDKLRVAEVGCGTGTLSLTFGLLGASITLIDSNEKVFERTRKIYERFGCGAEFIRADCLEPAPEGLAGTFDLVLSGGLAEHFTGTYRKKCFDFHRALLKPGGVAMIGVPNRFSPFYRLVRAFRVLTGTWELDVEVPFSNAELRALAESSGFKNCYVLGASSLRKDLLVYSLGFVSAVVELLPAALKSRLRKWKNGMEDKASSPRDPRDYAAERCREAFEAAKNERRRGSRSVLSNQLSSGLFLIGAR